MLCISVISLYCGAIGNALFVAREVKLGELIFINMRPTNSSAPWKHCGFACRKRLCNLSNNRQEEAVRRKATAHSWSLSGIWPKKYDMKAQAK